MPFTRTKMRGGTAYHYLVANERIDGRVRQKVLAYLGKHKTPQAAYRYWKRQAETAPDSAGRKHAREMAQKLEQFL